MAVLVYISAVAFIGYAVWKQFRRGSRYPLPPGPPSLPLLGHLVVMPTKDQELVYYQWSKQYGMFAFTT